MARCPARQCEQLCRLGPTASVVPLSQIEIADTVGLSVVHTNRSLQELRKLSVLAEKRCIEVLNKQRLQEFGDVDGRYLDPSGSLSQWDLRFVK